jgi:hypothetical protein
MKEHLMKVQDFEDDAADYVEVKNFGALRLSGTKRSQQVHVPLPISLSLLSRQRYLFSLDPLPWRE